MVLLKHQLKEETIVSPINGKVFMLAVNKPGAVINQGKFLVGIAPQNSRPIFRGQVKTKDSGFLKVGITAKIELDSHSWRE